jgi:insecticidal toxin complex protein TccC
MILYGDGLGRELQTKLKVESGLAWVRQPDGSYKEEPSLERWLTNGRAVYNNKGKPIKQYEPLYTSSFNYESEKSVAEFGVTPIIHYDPLGRVVRTDTPKAFFL